MSFRILKTKAFQRPRHYRLRTTDLIFHWHVSVMTYVHKAHDGRTVFLQTHTEHYVSYGLFISATALFICWCSSEVGACLLSLVVVIHHLRWHFAFGKGGNSWFSKKKQIRKNMFFFCWYLWFWKKKIDRSTFFSSDINILSQMRIWSLYIYYDILQ